VPIIAIVIDDVGLDRAQSARAAALMGPLTLSFLTYADDLAGQVRGARTAGHEIMLHVPMEPLSKGENPGPNALLTSLGADEVKRRLRWGLDRFEGYVALNNHMGSRFTKSESGMELVMAELAARGLAFLDSRTTGDTVGEEVARRYGVPFAGRDVFLDNDPAVAKVRAQLTVVEDTARREGHAVAIGHPHRGTIRALETWLPEVRTRGFALVPISAIFALRHIENEAG
jgi:polysaccharide deacetylase 2 family uncharacterized protein YibQ